MKKNLTAWLCLLPALAFLLVFMVYPLVDVFVYSFEEGYNFASQSYFGVGLYNYDIKRFLSDCLFSSLCDQYSGCRPCLYDPL